ncbi:hypothetical protein ATSB10_32170 [Dyella thiooxydans]|uniref:Uncharacterized protein n=1 Tax=Dyella thiooxydans TaxID=445710 RepID=A0A160N3V5_9GAMM|nr:hypothetical protein ATSB10_32170 [Dyella thiooxydans]
MLADRGFQGFHERCSRGGIRRAGPGGVGTTRRFRKLKRLLPRAGPEAEVSLGYNASTCGHGGPPATRLPAETVTCAGSREHRRTASHRTRPPAHGARRAGRSSDSRTRARRPT